jgi:hypothetical protein
MADKGIVINISGSGEGAAEALRMIEERMQQTAARGREMGAQLEEATSRIGAAMGHTTGNIAAASGAIREFEGTLPIRAVERFLTQTLGMGPILQAAFPLIGAIAFGEMLTHVGQELMKMRDSADAAASNITKDGETVNRGLMTQNDALETQVDKTIGEIDKLLGHPGANRLAEMFDEAREASDRLGTSISQDLEKSRELIDKPENQVSGWQSFMSGHAPTADTKKLLDNINQRISSVAQQYSDVVDRAASSGNSDNLVQAQNARFAALQDAYRNATKEIQGSYDVIGRGSSAYRDQTANLNMLSVALRGVAEQQRTLNDQTNLAALAQRKSSLGDGGVAVREAAKQQQELYDEIDRVTDEFAKKSAISEQALDEARLKLAEAYAAQDLALAKSSGATKLSALEDEQKENLISASEFLRARLKLTEDEHAAEASALESKASSLQDRYESESDPAKKLEIQAQLVSIYTQLNELSNQRALAEAHTTAELALQLKMQEQKMAEQKQSGAEYLQNAQDGADGKTDGANSKLSTEGAKAATQAVGSFMEQLSAGAIKGKLSMKSLVDSAIMDLDRFAIKLLEERSLIPLMNQLFGIGAGGPAGNGWSTPSEVGSVVNSGAFSQFAGGGDIPDGGMAIVGDGGDGSGSELFAPEGPGTVLPHDVLEGIAKGGPGGSGAPNVTLNNINNSSANVSMRQTGVSWDSDARQFVINTMLEDMQSGGPTAQAMRGFGATGG